jgi:hypothetical protein
MLTDTSLEQVLEECKLRPDGCLSTREANLYLARRGYQLGYTALWPKGETGEADTDIEIKATLAVNALVVVDYNKELDFYHAIAWDAQDRIFRDPHWTAPETTGWDKYRFFQWSPVIFISEEV